MHDHQYREIFPVTNQYVFLNNAAESPLNRIFKKALEDFLTLASEAPHQKPDVRWEVKESLSSLLGGKKEDYALVTSTGVGVGIVAAGLELSPGDNIVLPENEHRNNLFPWLHLKEKGIDVRLVPVALDGSFTVSDIEKHVDKDTKLIAVAAVRFNSGFRVNLKAISQVAHKNNALLFVDGIQAAGVVPIHMEEMGIDIFSSAGFKWLLGIPGTGFLYVNEHAREKIKPVLPGMFSSETTADDLVYYDDSRKYETGSIAYSAFYAWQYALRFISEIGVPFIYKRVLALTDVIISGLEKRNIEIISKVDDIEERSAILFFTLGNHQKNHFLQELLESENIIISVREGNCRISPSFYNNYDDILSFFNVLDRFLITYE